MWVLMCHTHVHVHVHLADNPQDHYTGEVVDAHACVQFITFTYKEQYLTG